MELAMALLAESAEYEVNSLRSPRGGVGSYFPGPRTLRRRARSGLARREGLPNDAPVIGFLWPSKSGEEKS